MFKSLGILLGGVFVGAAGMEVVRRKYPEAMEKVCSRFREVTSGAKEAFKKGYDNAARPREAAEPSA